MGPRGVMLNSKLVVLQCIGSTRPVRWLEIGRLNVTNSDKTVDRLTNSSDVLRDAHQQNKKCLVLLLQFSKLHWIGGGI